MKTILGGGNLIQIDYGAIKTNRELMLWAVTNFRLDIPVQDDIDIFSQLLFSQLVQRGQTYLVLESNHAEISVEVSRVINGHANVEDGWKQRLGFHLFREGTGSQVTFKHQNWW